jgi:hypothetical protein
LITDWQRVQQATERDPTGGIWWTSPQQWHAPSRHERGASEWNDPDCTDIGPSYGDAQLTFREEWIDVVGFIIEHIFYTHGIHAPFDVFNRGSGHRSGHILY